MASLKNLLLLLPLAIVLNITTQQAQSAELDNIFNVAGIQVNGSISCSSTGNLLAATVTRISARAALNVTLRCLRESSIDFLSLLPTNDSSGKFSVTLMINDAYNLENLVLSQTLPITTTVRVVVS
ncbi:OLC1v1009112C1 [Oldenlandia corymbosa var. corymbosa]|uniref:OLC1v1009112C1 n=1 Tax=Oldenlandia corymbosa var. corymbosa TaxID=529605 RepID=A0AAV1DNP8_OLDCO|nr:OLC1v1009112C1 [Oldenlandia corymbosa var. corymbosa]